MSASPPIVVRGELVSAQRDRPIETRQRLRCAPEREQCDAVVGMQRRVARSKSQCPLEVREGRRVLAARHLKQRLVVLRIGIVWIERDCLIEALQRLFQSTELLGAPRRVR